MVSDFMVAGLSVGFIFVILAAIDLILTKGKIFALPSRLIRKVGVPATSGMTAFVFLILGVLMLGGIGAAWNATGGKLLAGTAQITGAGAGAGAVSPICRISDVRMATIGLGPVAQSSNITFVSDDANNQNYYIDTYNSSAIIVAGGAGGLINGTLTVYLESPVKTGTECVEYVYAVGPSYKSGVTTTGANSQVIWSLLATTTAKSSIYGVTNGNRVDAINWQQKIYLNEGTLATTSSNPEFALIGQGAGTQSDTLGFAMNFASTDYNEIAKNSQVVITFKQRMGTTPSSSDPVIYKFTVRKGVLGANTA